MKAKALAALLAILLLGAPAIVMPAPVSAFSLGLEPVTGKVGASIKIPAFCQYGQGEYFIYWDDQSQLVQQGTVDTKGCAPIYFTIPQTTRGKHNVILKVGSESWSRDFTVTGGISLDVKKAPVGALVTVLGSGFEQHESEIYITFDGNKIAQNIEANGNGTWIYQLKIPASNKSSHNVSAAGTATSIQEVGNKAIEVTPSIAVNPSSGWVGRVVNVSGQGFGNGESSIAVLYDNTTVKSGLVANSNGSWQSSFSIPSSSRGIHKLDARGNMSTAEDVPEISFSVAPGIHIEQSSRKLGEVIHVDDTLIVSGIGFQGNESNIAVMFDNLPIVDKIIADAQGSWSAQFSIPATSYGDHVIAASGDSTKSNDVTPSTIFITPDLSINPDSGSIGDSMVLIGDGFSSNQPLTFFYDLTKITTSAGTDFKGNINTSFKPPVSNGGTHILTVSDGGGATGSVRLTIESAPPQVPALLSPEAARTYGLFDSAPILFTWSAVQDPSGVTYTIEISQKEDFSNHPISRDKLEKPEYKLQGSEKPMTGKLYWRVKAVDLAGNASDWSKAQFIEFSGANLIWPAAIGLVVLVIIILIVWRIRAISKKGGWKADTDS